VEAVVHRGDERAFGELYERHTPYLHRLALRLSGGDPAVAADLVHDAWVAAAPRFGTFARRAALRTWLAGFVVNMARRQWRDAVAADVPDTSEAVVPAFDAPLLARIDVERGLSLLPDGARQVLVLHDLEGWTHTQIAEQLAVDVGTSKSQLSRARALLRAHLASPDGLGGR
jgi:RNA polymerase sigma-70 factor (ECF subfamily)